MKKIRFFWGLILLIALSLPAMVFADNKNEPFGSAHAIKGGQLTLHSIEFPKSFNYFVNNSSDSAEVFELVYDTLMEMSPTTMDYQPLIAKSWTVSPDKKVFTIIIDPRAKWADGKPVTTADVKFTYDTIMNPKNLTSVQRMFVSRFSEPVVIDRYTIKFTAKTVHYLNLVTLASLSVLPKHLFEGKDFNKAFNMQLPPGSGPYVLSKVQEGSSYILTRRKNYWADQLPHHRGTYNFDSIKYKIMSLDTAFEGFKKGDFDIYDDINPKRWVMDTKTEHFQKNWIVKQKVFNYEPRGFKGFALNMRNPILSDLRVRQALTYLLDRKTIIEKIRYGQEKPLTSYWPSLYGSKSANSEMNYNPSKAQQLLKEAGYDRLDSNGVLVNKKGSRLEFTLLYVRDDDEPYLTVYVNSCKNVGINLKLQKLSWATLIKQMDEYKFDILRIAWTGTLFDDPEQLWDSKHIKEIGGSNLPGYSNPEVDRLIQSLPQMFDANQRIAVIKKIDSIIYKDVPYVLLFDRNFSWIFYKNVFGKPKTVFTKYGGGIIKYWWFDPAKEKKYREAVRNHRSLPKEPENVYYDALRTH